MQDAKINFVRINVKRTILENLDLHIQQIKKILNNSINLKRNILTGKQYLNYIVILLPVISKTLSNKMIKITKILK